MPKDAETLVFLALIVLWIDLEAELAAELKHAILPFAEPCAANGDDAAIRSDPVPDASAHAIARLEQHHRFAALTQPPRRRKAGKPRTDDAAIRSQSFHIVFPPKQCY
jgi:hypothetical protein